METLSPPGEQIQNNPEISGKLLPIVKDEIRVVYHGLRASIAEVRRERAGSEMASLEPQEAVLEENVPVAAEPGEPATSADKPNNFLERFKARRHEAREWKHQLAESRRKKVVSAFGGEATLPGSSRPARREVKRAYKAGQITAHERRTRLKAAELDRPMTETYAQWLARENIYNKDFGTASVLARERAKNLSPPERRAKRHRSAIEDIKLHHSRTQQHTEARDQARDRLEESRPARKQLKSERKLARKQLVEAARKRTVRVARKGTEYTGKAAKYTYTKGREHAAATRTAYHEGLEMSPDEKVGMVQRGINRSARKAGRGYVKAGRAGTAAGWAAKLAAGYEIDRFKEKRAAKKSAAE